MWLCVKPNNKQKKRGKVNTFPRLLASLILFVWLILSFLIAFKAQLLTIFHSVREKRGVKGGKIPELCSLFLSCPFTKKNGGIGWAGIIRLRMGQR